MSKKIVFCNNEITDIKYSGFTITKVYACDSELVYEKDQPQPIVCDDYKLTYLDTIGYRHNIPYNGSYQITISDTNVTDCNQASPYYNFVMGKCVYSVEDCTFAYGGATTASTGIEYIGAKAFRNNNDPITFLGVNPPIIHHTAFSGGTGKIIVPCEALDRYKAAWTDYASRITASTTSCTQLPVYDLDGQYDMLQSDPSHIGYIKLPDMSSMASPSIEMTVSLTGTNENPVIYSNSENWSISPYGSGIYLLNNGVRQYLSNSSCGASVMTKGKLTINSRYIGRNDCGMYASQNLSFGDLYIFKDGVNANVYEVKIYDNNVLVNYLIPMSYCNRAALFDMIGHRIYTPSGNIGFADE